MKKKKKPKTFLAPELRFPACSLILFDWPDYLMWSKKGPAGTPRRFSVGMKSPQNTFTS